MLCIIYFIALLKFVSALSDENPVMVKKLMQIDDINFEDNMINSVVQNITRVNNVLVSVLKNYAKLKNMYKTDATLSDESSDDEIDENFRQKNIADKQKNASESIAKTETEDKPHRGLFYSKERNPEESDNISGVSAHISNEKELARVEAELQFPATPETKFEMQTVTGGTSVVDHHKKRNKNKKLKNENKKTVKVKKYKTDHRKKVTKVIVDNGDIKKSTKHIKKYKNDVQDLKKTFPKPKTEEDKTINDDSKSIDSGESSLSAESGSFTDSKSQNNEISTTLEPSPERQKNQNTLLQNQKNPYGTVKKVIKTETFSKDHIWDEVVHKPINFNTENETTLHKQSKLLFRNIMSEQEKESKASTRKKPYIAALKLGTPTDTSSEAKNEKSKKKQSIESVEDEKVIKEEQFRTSVLRKAYGDACLKVVVKKCYKACQATTKEVCKKYNCNSKFKSSFKGFAKTACIKEFGHDEKMPEITTLKYKVGTANEALEGDFLDMSRMGYLSPACLPSGRAERRQANLSVADNQLNILRDRFEKACQEASAEKCTHACEYVTSRTCANVDCKAGKKEALITACKKECKNAYKYGSSKDDSDSDSGSSGSDSSKSDSSDRHHRKRKDKKKKKKESSGDSCSSSGDSASGDSCDESHSQADRVTEQTRGPSPTTQSPERTDIPVVPPVPTKPPPVTTEAPPAPTEPPPVNTQPPPVNPVPENPVPPSNDTLKRKVKRHKHSKRHRNRATLRTITIISPDENKKARR